MIQSRPWRANSQLAVLLLALAGRGVAAAGDPAELERRLAGASGAERVDILLDLSEAYMYTAPDKVLAYAEQAYEAATALSLAGPAARAVIARASGRFRMGDLDGALEGYRAGLAEAERLGDPLLIGRCLNGLAAVSGGKGDLDTALDYYGRAAAEFEKAREPAKLAGVYNNISMIQRSRGKYGQSLDAAFKAQRLYEEIGDENGLGIVLNTIGAVYREVANPMRARLCYERALAIGEKTGNQMMVVSCLINLGEIQTNLGELNQALVTLDRGLAVAREIGAPDLISMCLGNLGDALREKGETDAALEKYKESMRLFEEMGALPRLAFSYVSVGQLYLDLGRLREAETYLVKGFELGGKVQERAPQRNAAHALVKLYQRTGDFRSAFKYQRTLDELRQQDFSVETFEKVSSLQAELEAEKREREVELLRKESTINALEVRRQRLWLGLVVSGLVFTTALSGVLYNFYRLKRRSSAELGVAYKRVAELAQKDELTGLLNRRSATERLQLEVVRSRRTQRPFSIVLLDVDNFKKINDQHGHPCGDAVLRSLAGLLTSGVRAEDMVARWGGEEFLMLLPETPRDGAMVLAEKLRSTVADHTLNHDGREVRFTVTMGVSVYDHLASLDDCVRGADQALYAGKRSGKNVVVAATA
ncbi:MAG: diguanylate cyclase [Acidobacteriota bacterium]